MKQLNINNKIIAALMTCAMCLCGPVTAQRSGEVDVDQLKVAFVYNFSKYFSWPQDGKWLEVETFNICVDDANVANGQFKTLTGQSVQERTIRLVDLSQDDVDIGTSCHIWFVDRANYRSDLKRLEGVYGNSVLTIGEHPGFVSQGGIVELVLVDNRLRFKIDADLAEREQLAVSSRLMSLAIQED
ncbi:MAG: YfiR family protein [Gammaproteobacteria bacterium]|nr:YfiR family protein [Gammaproteobacteria bacterium]